MDTSTPITIGHLEITYNEDIDTWDMRDTRTGDVLYRAGRAVPYLGGVTDVVLYAVAFLNRETERDREEMHVWLCDAAQVR